MPENKDEKMTKKEILKIVIEKLKQEKAYFSLEDIKSLLAKENIEITPALFKKYIFELSKNGTIFDAGRSWYSPIKEPFKLNTKPIQSIVRKIKKAFPLLPFSCWSSEQLNPFTHHLLAKFITFVYIETDYMRNITELLKGKGYTVYENPNKAEIEKQFTINDKTVVIRPTIAKQPKAIDNCSPIEKILVDFLIENIKLYIMDNSEAENVVKNAVIKERINISELFSYAKERKITLPKSVTNSDKLRERR